MAQERNAVFGWISIALGLLLGLVLGLFSFDGPLQAPAVLADYSGLPRRLLRLSHIALVALGALNVLYARERPALRGRLAGPGGLLLLWGSLLLPPVLAAAAFVPPLRYLLGAPALLVVLGTVAIARARLVGARQAAGSPLERRARVREDTRKRIEVPL